MGNTLAILVTMSTYGTWLRGDARGWVDDGIIFPPDPVLEAADRARMKHEPYYFPTDRWLDVGQAMGDSLTSRMEVRILAMTIQSWHVHYVIAATKHHVMNVVKCAKDAVRWRLRIDRPIWAVDYDKRWCFDSRAVETRVDYVERHNLRNGWERRPWGFVEAWW